MSAITRKTFQELISKNEYIKKCSSNKERDVNSLSYLINRDMSQSECIKLGLGVESLLQDLVIGYGNLMNIKPKNKKGVKERDHLFKDEAKKIIYYAELKANINLDTEKCKSTYLKCLHIAGELQEKYPEYEIKWCLLGYRYTDFTKIPTNIQNKYSSIKENVFGINQYLHMLGIDLTFDEDYYKIILNDIADGMFNNS